MKELNKVVKIQNQINSISKELLKTRPYRDDDSKDIVRIYFGEMGHYRQSTLCSYMNVFLLPISEDEFKQFSYDLEKSTDTRLKSKYPILEMNRKTYNLDNLEELIKYMDENNLTMSHELRKNFENGSRYSIEVKNILDEGYFVSITVE